MENAFMIPGQQLFGIASGVIQVKDLAGKGGEAPEDFTADDGGGAQMVRLHHGD